MTSVRGLNSLGRGTSRTANVRSRRYLFGGPELWDSSPPSPLEGRDPIHQQTASTCRRSSDRAACTARGQPTFTESVPTGRSKGLLTYADASTTLVAGLTPGANFDVYTAVAAANKGRFGASELVSREWHS